MTIDECIDFIEDINVRVTFNDREDEDFFNSVGSFLEELKELRVFKKEFKDLGKLYSEIRKEERNKTIEDFKQPLLEICKNYNSVYDSQIIDISELLKLKE